jgi:hypothetical protein
VVDIEQRPLRPLEQHFLAGAYLAIQICRAIDDELLQVSRVAPVFFIDGLRA